MQIIKEKYYTLILYIIKCLILNRAYKGYLYWLSLESKEGVTKEEFKQFEFWKIETSFKLYFTLGKGKKYSDYRNAKIDFRSVVLNKIR